MVFIIGIERQDQHLLTAALLFYSSILIVGNLIADLVLVILDPCIRYNWPDPALVSSTQTTRQFTRVLTSTHSIHINAVRSGRYQCPKRDTIRFLFHPATLARSQTILRRCGRPFAMPSQQFHGIGFLMDGSSLSSMD